MHTRLYDENSNTNARTQVPLVDDEKLISIPHQQWVKLVDKDHCEYVVFEREAREFQSFHTFMFQLRHKNMMRVAHSYRKKVTRKSTLEYQFDYDEHITRASRSNTGTETVS